MKPILPCSPDKCILYARCNSKMCNKLVYLNRIEKNSDYKYWDKLVLISRLFEAIINNLQNECSLFYTFSYDILYNTQMKNKANYISFTTMHQVRLEVLNILLKENVFPEYVKKVYRLIKLYEESRR